MINNAKKFIVTISLVTVLSAMLLWRYRQDASDLLRRAEQGPLPPAISAEEVGELTKTAPPAEPAAITPSPPAPAVGPPPAPAAAETPAAEPAPADPAPAKSAPALPASINLKVPMVYQAPFSVWDAKDEDACEEASMLMVQGYLNGTTGFSREEMRRLIDGIVAYEMSSLGYFESTDAAQTAEIMRSYLKLGSVKVLPVASIDDIKRELAAGHPVMLGASGRNLHNPNFKNGGPVYHMLVAKGYKPGWIITNDPGTRKGTDYLYAEDVLFNALHDWNGGDVLNGAKVMIVAR
jgi:hypothetical protein